MASVTALYALRDKGQIQPNESILINGASGGIGTFAIQLATYFGARVTGVCSGKNAELVKSLGTSEVIDYTQHDFIKSKKQFDLVLDLVGNRSVNDLNQILNPRGRCVMVGYTNFTSVR